MFVTVFIGLIAADISILTREISKASRRDLLADDDNNHKNNK